MRKLILCALALSLLLPGCAYAARQSQAAENACALYYVEADLGAAAGTDAVRAETAVLDGFQELEGLDAVERLTQRLLRGPADETLKSPFPVGTQLIAARLEDGCAVIDLTYPYSTLSGISLTLADYCITLTLTQLPAVSSVSVTVRGQELAYRSTQSFTAEDLLLSSMEDVVSTVPVTLWFLDASGALTGTAQRLDLYEGDTQLSALVDALEAGPQERGLTSTLPDGFTVLTTQLSDGVCYVNLPGAILPSFPENTDMQPALDALALSLTSLEAVQQVRYLVDGEPAEWYGSAPIAQTYPRDMG